MCNDSTIVQYMIFHSLSNEVSATCTVFRLLVVLCVTAVEYSCFCSGIATSSTHCTGHYCV